MNGWMSGGVDDWRIRRVKGGGVDEWRIGRVKGGGVDEWRIGRVKCCGRSEEVENEEGKGTGSAE